MIMQSVGLTIGYVELRTLIANQAGSQTPGVMV